VRYLLDTNIYFAAIADAKYLNHYREVFSRIMPGTCLSSVVRFELLQGAKGDVSRARISHVTRHLERAGRVVAPTHADWVQAGTVQGRLWDDLPSLRSKSLQNDILIVCSTRRIGALIITDNREDFGRIRRYLPHRALSMAELAGGLGV
jgi:predicted nucleic acid-binding protein